MTQLLRKDVSLEETPYFVHRRVLGLLFYLLYKNQLVEISKQNLFNITLSNKPNSLIQILRGNNWSSCFLLQDKEQSISIELKDRKRFSKLFLQYIDSYKIDELEITDFESQKFMCNPRYYKGYIENLIYMKNILIKESMYGKKNSFCIQSAYLEKSISVDDCENSYPRFFEFFIEAYLKNLIKIEDFKLKELIVGYNYILKITLLKSPNEIFAELNSECYEKRDKNILKKKIISYLTPSELYVLEFYSKNTEKTQKKVAEIMNMKYGTFKKHANNAKSKVQKKLKLDKLSTDALIKMLF